MSCIMFRLAISSGYLFMDRDALHVARDVSAILQQQGARGTMAETFQHVDFKLLSVHEINDLKCFTSLLKNGITQPNNP
jgi:hypothetical protein